MCARMLIDLSGFCFRNLSRVSARHSFSARVDDQHNLYSLILWHLEKLL